MYEADNNEHYSAIVSGVWSEWESLRCSVFCGPGPMERRRECLGGVDGIVYECSGEDSDEVECPQQRGCIPGKRNSNRSKNKILLTNPCCTKYSLVL